MTNEQLDQYGWLIIRFTKNKQPHIAACLIDAIIQCSTQIEYQKQLDEYESLTEKYNDPGT